MKYICWIAVIVAIGIAGWRIVAPQITNIVFQDELRDSAAQLGWRTGVTPLNSDEDFRNIIIRKAATHDIRLEPSQVTVRRTVVGDQTVLFLAADYTVRVDLLVYSFDLHFNPTSKGGKF